MRKVVCDVGGYRHLLKDRPLDMLYTKMILLIQVLVANRILYSPLLYTDQSKESPGILGLGTVVHSQEPHVSLSRRATSGISSSHCRCPTRSKIFEDCDTFIVTPRKVGPISKQASFWDRQLDDEPYSVQLTAWIAVRRFLLILAQELGNNSTLQSGGSQA